MQVRKGEHVYSPEAVLVHFSEHFAGVLGGGRDLTDKVREQLDTAVREVEGTLVAKGGCTRVGEEPSLAEVQACVLSLRDVVAPGEDDIIAPLLKACPEGIAWLHRVILAVWKAGRVLGAWKRTLVVSLYKGKGSQQAIDNYRGINLLIILSKVYAMLFMHRVNQVVGANLHEAQCGFRSGRGIVDTMFVLRQLSNTAQHSKGTQLHLSFIDLTKAYNWVNQDALWRILRVYRVPSKIVELLEDLHIGTLATIRLGGDLVQEFSVGSRVRHGCIVAPLLFNVFLDFVVKQALASMPPDSGVSVQFWADGNLLFSASPEASLTLA